MVHMFTEKQLEILKNFKSHPIILHLDVTGSLIRKIDPNHKNLFYYALTIQQTPFCKYESNPTSRNDKLRSHYS